MFPLTHQLPLTNTLLKQVKVVEQYYITAYTVTCEISCSAYSVSVLIEFVVNAGALSHFSHSFPYKQSSSLKIVLGVMNCVNFVLLIVGVIAINVDGFPQTTKELAAATKLTEQHYYNNDVNASALNLMFSD